MRTKRLLALVGIPLLAIACATGALPSEGGGGALVDGGATGDLDASYGGTTLDDGAFVPPADAAAHGGVDAGPRDSGATPIDSGGGGGGGGGGTSDTCPSGNTSAYNVEWFFSSTPCTPGNGDCDPGDCCYDRSAGSGDPYCITP